MARCGSATKLVLQAEEKAVNKQMFKLKFNLGITTSPIFADFETTPPDHQPKTI
jgi:hypothetical protein